MDYMFCEPWTQARFTWNRDDVEVGWENTRIKTVNYKVEIKCQFVSIENMCDQKRYFKVVKGSSQSLPLRIFSISCMDWFLVFRKLSVKCFSFGTEIYFNPSIATASSVRLLVSPSSYCKFVRVGVVIV